MLARCFSPFRAFAPTFTRSFTALTELHEHLANAEKKYNDLTKLYQEFDDMIKWFDTVAKVNQGGKREQSDELLEKVKAQKAQFARLRDQRAATVAGLKAMITQLEQAPEQ
jgi:uncharacterized protein (DUF342 family)